jgi:hypothetical protein
MAAFYLGLLPFIARTWRATGDEPHYLLAAHSLAVDRDFDLANNYEQLDYLNFYFSREIDRQIRLNRAGQQILNHQPGLAVLIAPAYAGGGRPGVLAFQAALGGLLAALTFKLAAFVSRDRRAALLATLFVGLSPPLLMYHYLVYPELIGALLATLITYLAVTRRRATPAVAGVVLVSLCILPWLNRRFIPLALVLFLFIVWAWRGHSPSRPPSRSRLISLLTDARLWTGLAAALSIGLLFWFNSQLDQPVRADITVPVDSTTLWTRLGRGIGWLVDQQRGLFIFAPIYLLAVGGLPFLLENSFKARDRTWFVVVPLLISLAVTTAAGGYWVPWELGPRFLVVGLPALAPVLALAWRYYSRRWLWAAGVLVFFALSLANSLLIILHPELPYNSSLPVYYSQKLNLPLTDLLPDLAGYARISPPAGGQAESRDTTGPAAADLWFAEAGAATAIVQSRPLHELPFGHYKLTWPVRAEPGLPPATELMRLSVKFLGGGQLFNKVITAADLPADGRFGLVEHTFTNPNTDRWRTPMIFHAVSRGESDLWGQLVLFTPRPLYAWVLPYLSLTLIALGSVWAWRRWRVEPLRAGRRSLGRLSPGLAWGLAIAIPLLAGGYLVYRLAVPDHRYEAARLQHLTGQAATDPAARDGRVWQVDPRTDPPQKAVYGPFDLYDRGQYHVTFRMKLAGVAEPGQALARLRVAGAAGPEPLMTQALRPEHFSETGLYHDFVLVIANPRRQALNFEVDYLGVAALAIDDVTITRMRQ